MADETAENSDEGTQSDESAPPADTQSDDQAPAAETTGDDPAGESPYVSRAQFEEFQREQGLFHAEVRETLGRMSQPPAAEAAPAAAEESETSLAPEAKPEPKPEEKPAPKADSEAPARYGSKRWFAGR